MWMWGVNGNRSRSRVSRNYVHGDPFDRGAGFQRYFHALRKIVGDTPISPGMTMSSRARPETLWTAGFCVLSFLIYSSPFSFSIVPTTVTPVSLPARPILSLSSGRTALHNFLAPSSLE